MSRCLMLWLLIGPGAAWEKSKEISNHLHPKTTSQTSCGCMLHTVTAIRELPVSFHDQFHSLASSSAGSVTFWENRSVPQSGNPKLLDKHHGDVPSSAWMSARIMTTTTSPSCKAI